MRVNEKVPFAAGVIGGAFLVSFSSHLLLGEGGSRLVSLAVAISAFVSAISENDSVPDQWRMLGLEGMARAFLFYLFTFVPYMTFNGLIRIPFRWVRDKIKFIQSIDKF